MGEITKFNRQSWERHAGKFKALGHPVRLWIAVQLIDAEHCVQELVERSGMDFSTISQHLAIMSREKIVASQKRGKFVYYFLCCPCAKSFLKTVSDWRASRSCLKKS